MSFFQALFLAFIQGITEFLPISSSGHLVLFQKIFHLSRPPVFFDILLHLGTLGSILIFFRREIVFLLVNWQKEIKFWYLLLLGSIPVAIFGLLFNSHLKTFFNSLFLLSIAWILFGIGLLASRRLNQEKSLRKEIGKIDALAIGFFQALALFPGVSRSGSTIIGGLVRGLPPEVAFKFSFFLAIPAILGATVLELKEATLNEVHLVVNALSVIVAGVTGYWALSFLQKTLKWEKFYLFGFYCLVIGTLALFFSFRI